MPRKTHFVDLPVQKDLREKIKRRKGKQSYDEFLRDILNMEIGL